MFSNFLFTLPFFLISTNAGKEMCCIFSHASIPSIRESYLIFDKKIISVLIF